MPEEQDVAGAEGAWTFGYIFDVILTRDPFMHRIDIAQATGIPMEPDSGPRGAHRRRRGARMGRSSR